MQTTNGNTLAVEVVPFFCRECTTTKSKLVAVACWRRRRRRPTGMAGDGDAPADRPQPPASSTGSSPLILSIRRPGAGAKVPAAAATPADHSASTSTPASTPAPTGMRLKLRAPAPPPQTQQPAAVKTEAPKPTAATVPTQPPAVKPPTRSSSRQRPTPKPLPIPSFKAPPIPVVRLSSNIPVVPPPVLPPPIAEPPSSKPSATRRNTARTSTRGGAGRKPPRKAASTGGSASDALLDPLLRPKVRRPGGVRDVDEALGEAPLEEHLILRVPSDMAARLRERVRRRDPLKDISLHFHETRRGTFTINTSQSATAADPNNSNKSASSNTEEKHSAHLVDLPCIIESHKTIDGKQFYKVADIAQMIVIDPTIRISKDYSWPDGITMPLQNVRKRRFRKRISKKTIEDVEQEVERLLLADAEAEDVRYDVHERREGDDSLYGDEGASEIRVEGSDVAELQDRDGDGDGDDATGARDLADSRAGADGGGGADGSVGGGDADDDADRDWDLAAEIQEALDADDANINEEPEEEEEKESDDDSADDDDDSVDDDAAGAGVEEEEGEGDNESEDGGGNTAAGRAHLRKQTNLIQHEIQDLERKLASKKAEAASQVNPIMRKRFDVIVTKLASELDIKRNQLKTVQSELDEGEEQDAVDTIMEQIDQIDQIDQMDQADAAGVDTVSGTGGGSGGSAKPVSVGKNGQTNGDATGGSNGVGSSVSGRVQGSS